MQEREKKTIEKVRKATEERPNTNEKIEFDVNASASAQCKLANSVKGARSPLTREMQRKLGTQYSSR